MPACRDILLVTSNASHSHAAFGLRYLMANMGALQSRTEILEFTIKNRTLEMVETILARDPKIVGIGVYIWNARESLELVAALKRLRPTLLIVLGGPEVSFETEEQEITHLVDHVITGEADLAFAELCARLLAGERPPEKIIAAPLPHFGQLTLPYSLYSDQDIASRVVYVEASRGCPFTCEFCLSSLDIPVRSVPLERMLPELETLISRGLRQFKFVDRTFNLNLQVSRTLLQFFLDHWHDGMFLHFEMIPDRLPEGLRELIAKFPPGSLQFEVGIQTFQELASKNISRRNNHVKTEENFAWLRGETGVHIHADLIVGLPGENMESFGTGFDRLHAMGPQEIQVGILKRLRGTPIIRQDADYGMIYSSHPPYEILENKEIPFIQMQRMRRFAKYWDMIGNSGNYIESTRLLFSKADSPFNKFLALTDWLHPQLGATDGIAMQRLAALLFEFITTRCEVTPDIAAAAIWRDYTRGRTPDKPPGWLAPHLPTALKKIARQAERTSSPARQLRHHGGN